MRTLTTLVMIITSAIVLADPPPQPKKTKMTKEDLDFFHRRVFRGWMEIKVEDSKGTQTDPFHLYGYRFYPDRTETWCRRGELSLGHSDGKIILRADTDPMQFDVLSTPDSNGKVHVTPGIIRFEKHYNQLILVEPTSPSSTLYREDGNYKIRPTSFTPTKENKYRKTTLVPRAVYDED